MLTRLLEEILMSGRSPEPCTSPANYLPYSLTAILCLCLAVQAALCYVGVFVMTLQRKGNFENTVSAFICPTHNMLYSKMPVIVIK